ncbi:MULTISPECIES: AzlC family ABC transporter permease [unclassified Aminobacter]|uniref:AzlC family ABC transporter permease n=1 Tax=unclassified Aminobacter TaxID=2644704 RepID=UPI0004663101|nr:MULTISPECIES: AzlC family ABC transporter permease [unclassified Aminobacter]TWH33497.1 putative branched-subunit amino acid permease [Aminobacter sp. J15]
MNAAASASPDTHSTRIRWFFRGVSAAVSIPGLILISAFVGFAGLAREAGITLPQAVFMTGLVWALPAKVVLIGAIMSGASLPAAALAVSLSSVRLTPMVVALMPELRSERGRPIVLYLLSHFVAVTSWVIAMEKVREVPREMRTSWYAGLGGSLVLGNMVVVALVYAVAGSLPPILSAALLLLTPIYFLTSLWGSAREAASHYAMIFGIVLGPVFHLFMPGGDLMAAGFIGGIGAYVLYRLRKGQGA